MRYITNLSYNLMTPVEELTREGSTLSPTSSLGKVFHVLCFQTLAERLWTPFRLICFNPIISLGVLIVLYLVFTLFFLPLYLLSFIITSYGAFIIFLILFHFLIIYIIRLIAFPGCNLSTQKSLSQDFWKRILSFLENITMHSNQYASTMLLIANGQLPIQEIYTNMQELQKILMMIEYFPNMILYLQDTIDYCKSEKELNFSELKLLSDLITQLETYYQAFHYLYHFLNEEYYHISSHSILTLHTTQQQHYHHQQKNQRLLMTHASRCLKSSEAMRVLTQSLLPEGSEGAGGGSGGGGNEDEDSEGGGGLNQNNIGFSQLTKLLCSFREKMNSFEHVTFPYMRSILNHRYGGKNYWIKASNSKDRIDGVYINAGRALELQKQPPKKISPTSSNSSSTINAANNTNSTSNSNTNNTGRSLSIQVPASSSNHHNNQNHENSSSYSSNPTRSNGLVLFCNPNAAYYETISQQDFEKSWLGYYINLGYDVFVYNYPGYGRSTGRPSPTSLQADGQAVIDFLRKEFPQHDSRIIVHGESIGGLVACSIAANENNRVAALICDRTFASLDATASRLMGSWAGNFMKFGALWNTNVVNNYLKTTCPKLVLQDPADEIIYESASLKSGVSYKLCLNDDWYNIPAVDLKYSVAYYLKEEIPNADQANGMIEELKSSESSLQLTPRFILHFYYCFLRVAYLSTLDYHNSTSNNNMDVNNNAGGGLLPLSQIEMIQRKGGLSSTSNSALSPTASGDMSPGRSNSKRGGKMKILSNSNAELPDSSYDDRDDANNDTKTGNKNSVGSNSNDHGSSNATSTSMKLNQSNGSNSQQDQSMGSIHPLLLSAMTSRKAKLEDYLALKMTDSNFEGKPLLPFKKAFVALYRISNGCDYLLGHAMSKSLDTLQAWLCGYLVWNAMNVKTNSHLASVPMTPGPNSVAQKQQQEKNMFNRSPKEVNKSYRKSVKDCINDLQYLLDELHPDILGKSDELQFIRSALIALHDKQEAFHHPNLSHNRTNGGKMFSSSSSAFKPTSNQTNMTRSASKDDLSSPHLYHQSHTDHDLESSLPLMKQSSDAPGSFSRSGSGVLNSPKSVRDYFSTTQCCASPSPIPSSNVKALIGDLLPLHTGHNGWLHSYELKYMTEWLERQKLIPEQD